MHAPNQQPQSQGPLFLWSIGFLALGTLSAIGASSLFPWYLAIIIAILVAGLASACAYQLRRTKNLLFLVATVAMTLLAAGLDGVSVWEILNKRHNGHLSVVTAEQSVLESELSKAEARIQVSHEEIDLLIEEATTMDNDGMGHNDHMIPGKLEKIRSKRETLAGLKEELELLRAEVLDATAATAQTDTGRHVLLQMASEREEPAQWLIGCAALVFMIPEFTLVLLAWSLRGPGDHQPPYLPTPQPEPSPTQPETVQLQAPKGRGVAALTGKMNGEAIVPPLFANSAPAGFGEIMGIAAPEPEPAENITPKTFSPEETLGDLAEAEIPGRPTMQASEAIPAEPTTATSIPAKATALTRPRANNVQPGRPIAAQTSLAARRTSTPKSTTSPRRKSSTLAQMAKLNRLH